MGLLNARIMESSLTQTHGAHPVGQETQMRRNDEDSMRT